MEEGSTPGDAAEAGRGTQLQHGILQLKAGKDLLRQRKTLISHPDGE